MVYICPVRKSNFDINKLKMTAKTITVVALRQLEYSQLLENRAYFLK